MTAARRFSLSLIGLVVVLIAADRLAAIVAPPQLRREVDDGVHDLATLQPTTLLIGSSHARSFEWLGAEAARRSGGAERLAVVPVEAGKLTSYAWVLHERLAPVVAARHPPLRRLIIVSSWWDSCNPSEGVPANNVAARGWAFPQFASDLFAHGLTDHGRAYLTHRWERLTLHSALLNDRGHGFILPATRARLTAGGVAASADADARRAVQWQEDMVAGARCMQAPEQMSALDSLVAWGHQQQLAVDLVLFPLKPATIIDAGRISTLAPYAAHMRAYAEAHGARLVDLTEGSPLQDRHFQSDFDHLNAEGNALFGAWALDHDFAALARAR